VDALKPSGIAPSPPSWYHGGIDAVNATLLNEFFNVSYSRFQYARHQPLRQHPAKNRYDGTKSNFVAIL